jgi:vanillate O-demethylase monooxygenase subunit
MPFLRNIWYAAAWSEEIAPGALFARTIIELPLVFFRNDNGDISALLDRCPHRFAALSLGKLESGTLACRYHGLRFNAEGRCVGNPHGPVLSSIQVQTYRAVERHALVWVWLGDAALADPANIPDMSFHDSARETAFNKGYLFIDASHHLLVDNILDLCHADYLHPESLGNGWITRNQAKIEEAGHTLFVEWLGFNEPPTPLFEPELPPGSMCDTWLSVLWRPSGAMTLRSGITLPGQPQAAGKDSINGHIMTPETARSTHYFHSSTRDFRADDAGYNQQMYHGLRWAFEHQDRPMIEAQQRRIGSADLLDLGPALMPIDIAPVRARRIYDRLLAEEIVSAGIATLPA